MGERGGRLLPTQPVARAAGPHDEGKQGVPKGFGRLRVWGLGFRV